MPTLSILSFNRSTIAQAAIGLSVLAFAALPVDAQQAPASGTNAQGAQGGSSATASRDQGSQKADADREFMEDLAQANLAEIDTGKLALDKAKDPKVTKFAQQMIDDHTKALDDLRKIAQAKNVEIPTEPDFAHKAMATALKATSGDFFEKQYVEHVGVGDHRRTIDLLKEVQREAKDADLKAYAAKVLPVVERHLTMARTLNESQ